MYGPGLLVAESAPLLLFKLHAPLIVVKRHDGAAHAHVLEHVRGELDGGREDQHTPFLCCMQIVA
jgi:hypothetical protein